MGQEYANVYKFKILKDDTIGTYEMVRVMAPDARKAQATLVTAIEPLVVLEAMGKSLTAVANLNDDVLVWTPDDGAVYNK